jgi:hypothetical protein
MLNNLTVTTLMTGDGRIAGRTSREMRGAAAWSSPFPLFGGRRLFLKSRMIGETTLLIMTTLSQ